MAPKSGTVRLPHYQGGNSSPPLHVKAPIIRINCSIYEPNAQRRLGYINEHLSQQQYAAAKSKCGPSPPPVPQGCEDYFRSEPKPTSLVSPKCVLLMMLQQRGGHAALWSGQPGLLIKSNNNNYQQPVRLRLHSSCLTLLQLLHSDSGPVALGPCSDVPD